MSAGEVFGAAYVGKRVLAVMDHANPAAWVIGRLVSVCEDGEFVIDVDEERRRLYCWPLLHVEAVPDDEW